MAREQTWGRRARAWRVGDLAAATGVTVRTLHHYEQVGVLVPSERTEAGHRLYRDAEGGISTDDLLLTIEGMAMHERYFTKEQLEALARRRGELGEEAIRRSEQEWAELADALRRHMEAGDDPASAPVRLLAQRAGELVRAFTGGDPEMYASLRRMRENEDPLSASRGLMDSDLVAYLERAIAALRAA